METVDGTVGREKEVGVAAIQVAGIGLGAGEDGAGAQANRRMAVKTTNAGGKSSLIAAFFGGIQATG
jgi:hypothetical protein